MLTPPEVVSDFAALLIARARTINATPSPPETFDGLVRPPIPLVPWLMDEITTLLDKEEWTPVDTARLSSLFFFLLVRSEP